MIDLKLPHNRDLEGEAVAAVYTLPREPREVLVSALRPEFFFDRWLGDLFGHAEASGFNPTVAYDLAITKDKGVLEALPKATFHSILGRSNNFFAGGCDPEKLADRIHKLFLRREVMKVSRDSYLQAFKGDVDPMETEKKLRKLDGAGSIDRLAPLDSLKEVMDRATNGMKDTEKFFTGFPRLDETARGLQRSEFVVVAGMPNIGKTPFLINTATNRAEAGFGKQLIFSLEMTKAQIIQKVVSQRTGIPSDAMLYGIQEGSGGRPKAAILDKIKETIEWANDHFLIWDPSMGQMDLQTIRGIARRAAMSDNLDAIYVDYIQLLGEEYAQLTHTSRILKGIPLEIGVPVMAISSLGNDFERRLSSNDSNEPFYPRMSDLRGCGNIAYDASKILFVMAGEREDTAKLFVMKSKFGPGRVWSGLRFDKSKQRFAEEETF